MHIKYKYKMHIEYHYSKEIVRTHISITGTRYDYLCKILIISGS